ncbi:hypothetical protein BDF14DRAFT_1854270 [Spinellus fusiger]|nr:hypothetical protein BDF14DRAFT_1854270 [Spinellus fusiger]
MSSPQPITTFEAFSTYNFENDQRFKDGMSSLLERYSQDNSLVAEDMIEQARWFYYTKFIEQFDLSAYRQWKKNNGTVLVTTETESPATDLANTPTEMPAIDKQTDELSEETKEEHTHRRFTFQELVEMIESGKEIPGIKQIPTTLNQGKPSEAKMGIRRKPWEQNPQ